MRILSSLTITISLILISIAGQAGQVSSEPEAVPGELVIKLTQDQASTLQAKAWLNQALNEAKAQITVETLSPFQTDSKLFRAILSEKTVCAVKQAISALKGHSGVVYAEPNYIYRISDEPLDPVSNLPDDTGLDLLWGLYNTGQTDSAGQVGTAGSDIDVVPLWNEGYTGSRDVVVAVIDTGVDWTHPDLVDNIWTNPGEAGDLATNGVDDDGNGFVDDVHGWNFITNTNNSVDDHSHGTHVSGTIGGMGNNAQGVVGVNWEVSIVPIKFLSASGSGTLEAAVESINYATLMGVNLSSNSWGGGGFTQSMFDAIQAARDKDILFVAAAGNNRSNNDSTPSYPASYDIDNVVSVAATDNQDKLASFSNWGATTVHVAAPGVNVYSTVKNGGYDTYSGTSMACPHTAGTAALLLSANAELTYAEVKDRLIRTSDPVRGLRRKVASNGRLNAYNALHDIVPPSSEPDDSLWQDVQSVIESSHPYANSQSTSWTVTEPGAKYVRLHFERIETEARYDIIRLETPSGELIEAIDGSSDGYTSDYILGDSLVIRFVTDSSVTGWGFKMDKLQVIRD